MDTLHVFHSHLSTGALLEKVQTLITTLSQAYDRLQTKVTQLSHRIEVAMASQESLMLCVTRLRVAEMNLRRPLRPSERAQRKRMIDFIKTSTTWVQTWETELLFITTA